MYSMFLDEVFLVFVNKILSCVFPSLCLSIELEIIKIKKTDFMHLN
jgi:hypothetical protein